MKPTASDKLDHTRRGLISGKLKADRLPHRPPWTTEDCVVGACTRCNACLLTCPEGVLKTGQGGFPAFDPSLGTGLCTFCGVCAAVCPADVFDLTLPRPWALVAEIENGKCLAHAGIHCSSCRDACDEAAIRMPSRIGGPPLPEILDDRCSGCGACSGVCPGAAVSLKTGALAEAAA